MGRGVGRVGRESEMDAMRWVSGGGEKEWVGRKD